MAMHKNPHPNRVAEAPFNFVPLPEAVFTPEPVNCTYGEYAPQRHSGWIDLQIKAETPLYVRCAPPTDRAQPDNAGDNPHRRPFFHHGNPNLPVLPGSSIRGMTRALFEVLTYGKMSYAGRQLVYRAVGDPGSVGDLYRSQLLGRDQAKGQTNNGRKPTPRYNYPSPNVRGGYLEIKDNKRYIRPACEIKGETFVHVDYKTVNWAECNQQEYYKDIYVEPVERTNSQNRGFARIELILAVTPRVERRPMKGLEKATLVVSGHMGNLRNPAPHDKHMHCAIYEPDPDNNKLIEIKEELWELYYEDSEMHRGIKTRKIRSSGDPLFYLLDDNGELVFFGPTLMFRVPYPHSISDFIPGDLKDSQTVDLTEAVFGSTSIRSRVSFEDAPYTGSDDNKFYGDVSPSILGSPKPTAFQQYLTQDQPDDKKKLRHYGDSPVNTTIRGYKFYWHKSFNQKKYWESNIIKDSQHTIMRPLKAGSTFHGRVRFDNLSDLELGALLTALDLPNDMRHKIGMGKPLGMGTIRITATPHFIDRRKRYSCLLDDHGYPATGEKSTAESQILAGKAKAAFAEAILQHHQEKCASKEAMRPAGLWDIPRLKELGVMLRWKPDREHYLFDYPAPDARGGINGRWWRQRRVIPTPSYTVKLAEHNKTTFMSPTKTSDRQKKRKKQGNR